VAPRWLDPYTVGHYMLEVSNDVFSGMENVLSCRPATLRTGSVAWRRALRSPNIVEVHYEWSTGPT
jgi:hypothetical protein